MTVRPPFDIRAQIAVGARLSLDPSLWSTYRDIGAYRRQAADVEINVGRDDEASDVEAGDSSATYDERDGLLSPRNPNSAYFGKIGVNTPIRYVISSLISDDFDRTVSSGWGTSTTGHVWGTASSSLSVSSGTGKCSFGLGNFSVRNMITGGDTFNFDFYYTMSINTKPTGAAWATAVMARYVDAQNYYRLHAEFQPDGTISTKIVRRYLNVETTLDENVFTGITYTAGQKVWVHAQATGPSLRTKVWTGNKTDEPALWHAYEDDGFIRGSQIGLFNWRLGEVTNAGTLTASFDDVQVDPIVWEGYVPEFPLRWDKSGSDSTATLTGAGMLRRLNQSNPTIQSALRHQLPRYGPTGYWPFEDEAGATQAASALSGGLPATIRGEFTFAASNALPGGGPMAQMGSSAGMFVTGTGVGSTGVGFAGLGFFKLETLPAVDNTLISWRSAGTVVEWRVNVNHDGMWLEGYDRTGTQVVSTITTVYPTGLPLNVFSVQLETAQSGGNISYTLLVNWVGSDDFWVMANGTVAGTAGSGLSWALLGGSQLYSMTFGHIWLGPNTLPYVNATFLLVSSGYAGELATDRLARLFAEQGLPLALGPGDGEPMGAQPAGKFLDVVKDTTTTDGGLLYEAGLALGYLPRVSRYNLPYRLTLDWTGGDLAEAPEPTDDDQRLRNVWTASRPGGSSAVAQNDDSVLQYGSVYDEITANTETDERLIYIAQWQASLGSVDEMRWPVVRLNLIKHPEFIPDILSMQIGDRIQIINPKVQLDTVKIDLIVEGIKQTIGRYAWDVELSCSPSTPWGQIGVYDSSANRYDTKYAQLSAGVTNTATAITISSAMLHGCFSQTAEPYDIMVAGERMTVTSAGAISGSGPYTQTLTVTRSVNGISKAQVIFEAVRIATPGRYAL